MIAIVSEIKQLLHIPGFQPRVDPDTAAEYLYTGYEEPTRSFFHGVTPIPAGCWIKISLDDLIVSAPESFWFPELVKTSVTHAVEAAHAFADKAKECVRLHMRSDVPVGSALSGGLDSSSITVLAAALSTDESDALHTFTVTFPGHPADERDYAEAVTKKIRCRAHYITPQPATFLEDLDHFLWLHDEPVDSLSKYAGYCLARLARDSGISVVLNGQGGDEILSGYWQSYFLYLRELWRAGRILDLSSHFVGAVFGHGNPSLIGQIPVMARRYRSRKKSPLQTSLKIGSGTANGDYLSWILSLDAQARRVHETRTIFLPRLLKWEDRNSMAFSVEGRYPFLDHELIELCLSFAPEVLYHRGWTKYPLRLGLNQELPFSVLHRKSKFGFETPQDGWLCGPLRSELERWLKSDNPVWDYIDRNTVRRLAEQTWRLMGKKDEPGQALFRAFIFDRWLTLFKHDNNAVATSDRQQRTGSQALP